MNQNKIIVVDNFFDNFYNFENKFKEIKLYECDEFKKISTYEKFNYIFPGKKSLDLYDINVFFYNLILKEFNEKFNNFYQGKYFFMSSYIHLRLSTDNKEDFIHKDPALHTLIIYLSETNLNSGTILYDDNKIPTTTVNFVQNRAVIFPGQCYHKSMLNYGDSINNGRLTLNCFFNLK